MTRQYNKKPKLNCYLDYGFGPKGFGVYAYSSFGKIILFIPDNSKDKITSAKL